MFFIKHFVIFVWSTNINREFFGLPKHILSNRGFYCFGNKIWDLQINNNILLYAFGRLENHHRWLLGVNNKNLGGVSFVLVEVLKSFNIWEQ